MVRAYVGTRGIPSGSGKTLSMMNDIRQFLLKEHPKSPYKIVSNTEFYLREIKYHSFSQKKTLVEYRAEVIKDKASFFNALVTYTNTIFMIDEASVWADQYNWKDVPEDFYNRLKQLRKANIHLLYTVQAFQLVATRLRTFTNIVIECEPFPRPNIEKFTEPPRPLWVRQWWRHPQYFDMLDKIIGNKDLEKEFTFKSKTVFFSELKRTFPAFDTYELTQ